VSDIKEVVRRFDEDLCTKSNKSEISMLKGNFENNFVPNSNWKRVQNLVDAVKKDIIN